MDEFLQSATGIITLILGTIGGVGGLGTFISSFIIGHKNKKYTKLVAANQAKDERIDDLSKKFDAMINAFAYLIEAIAIDKLSIRTLDPSVKTEISNVLKKVQTITKIDISDTIKSVLDVLTDKTGLAITEEKKEQIVAQAAKAQTVLNEVGNIVNTVDDLL